MKKIIRKIRRAVLRDEPTYYDMFLNPGERFFARIYLHEIRRTLESAGRAAPLEILDAGCQAGRLAVPLASAGHCVTGVDTSDLALRRARRHAREAGAQLRLLRADLGRWLPRTPPASFDVVVCTEVLYLRTNHRELLAGLLRVLRPGGLCFISHRPPGYYLAEAAGRKDWDAVRTVLTQKEGTLFGSYYNWQDREDLEKMYAQAGVEVLSIRPVGLVAWLAVRPDDFASPEEEEALFRAELSCADRVNTIGRYLLVSGRKEIASSGRSLPPGSPRGPSSQ